MTTPLPATGSTDWYGWATQVDSQARAALPATRWVNTISAYDYGARGDCNQPNSLVSTTSGQTSVSITVSAFPGLAAGMKFFIEGQGLYTVASVGASSVTFTTNLTGTASGRRCFYGTDNTSALNAFFAACLTNGQQGIIPTGRFLITGTVGVLEPGTAINPQGTSGLSVLCGGAVLDSMRLAEQIAGQAGTSLVWAGATGGTMMQLARTTFPHFQGGLSLVGMASSDPSGTFSTFGNRPGIGLHFSQAGTPEIGTGYMALDQIVCSDMGTAIQFGTNTTDNNVDTTVINQALFNRCTDGIVIKHDQGLAYRFNWIHGISCTRSVLRCEGAGGAVEVGSLHLSACGTATANQQTDTYCVDLTSGVNGYIFKINLLRIESGTVRTAAVRNGNTFLQVDTFEEANNSSTDSCQFLVVGGAIQIFGGRLVSYYSAGQTPFALVSDGNSIQPRLYLREMELPNPIQWHTLLVVLGSTVMDVSVEAARTNSGYGVHQDRHTRLERGPVILGGPTTDATTVTQLDPLHRLGGASYQYSYGPRIPQGASVVEMTLIGDRGTASPSVFKRRWTLYRTAAGAVTVVSTETIGTDLVQGTDQFIALTLDSTFDTMVIQVRGTAAVTINWRARLVLQGMNVNPSVVDY